MASPQAVITDHSLIRYMERVKGIDLEPFREALADLVRPYAEAGVSSVELGGWWFIFEGKNLVTITYQKPNAPKYDRGTANQTAKRLGPLPWQGKARRRAHV